MADHGGGVGGLFVLALAGAPVLVSLAVLAAGPAGPAAPASGSGPDLLADLETGPVERPAGDLPALEPAAPAPLVDPEPELAWIFPEPGRPGWGEVAVPPVPDLAPLQARGAELFAARCAACHGAGGRGDGWLAPSLPAAPRDLAGERFRTRAARGRAAPGEVFRTLTTGAPAYGMPSFAALPAADRWALVAHVLELAAAEATAGPTAPLEPRRARAAAGPDLRWGQHVYGARCASCHGAEGRGDGPLAAGLAASGFPPTDLRRGPEAFRGGARAEDVVRLLALGRPGTPMVPHPLGGARDQRAVAAWVARLAAIGRAERRAAWDDFFRRRRGDGPGERGEPADPPPERWDPEISARFAAAPDGRRGCLACHEGIEAIARGPMAEAIDAFAGGDPDEACRLCHGGETEAAAKAAAHEGMVGNPASLWVTSLGLGCGRCHSDRGALTSLMGLPLPEARGGDLLEVVSRLGDPTGASERNHAYRMQRALMAQETGKVLLTTASAGLVDIEAPRYTDFPIDDPDGPEPCAGSEDYREFVARAEASGYLLRLDRGEGVPTFDEALAETGDVAVAAFADYYRKDCGRCHLWGEGRPSRGERRSAGCAACHVFSGIDGRSLSGDPTIPKDRPGHPFRHELAWSLPESQCNHCHTRGVATQHSEAHQVAGIGCADCHTSIDVHGDGNIYGSIEHQLEVRCEDCHGTAEAAPWELPVGHDTPAASAGPRGTWTGEGGQRHLLTSRGNPRRFWLRDGDGAVLVSRYTGERHEVPLLRDRLAAPGEAAPADSAHADWIPAHDRLSCSACHSDTSPRCMPCHVTYFGGDPQQDWLLSARDYDPASTRQRPVLTPGAVELRPLGGMAWGASEVREDRAGRLSPRVPGCDVTLTHYAQDGTTTVFRPLLNPRSPGYPPPVAPHLAHENALPPRGCQDCHPDGPASRRLPGSRAR